MNILQRLFRSKSRREQEISPEVALAMQELDTYLAREFALLEDNVGAGSKDVRSLLHSFAQRCQKVALVGSYRRGVENPKDIDVLYIPKSNMQALEFIEQIADDENSIRTLGSGFSCQINGQRVDFITTTQAKWGMDLIQFTGSREFNLKVIRHANRRGYKVDAVQMFPTQEVHNSYSSWVTLVFNGWSEEKILEHLGLGAYLDPRTRQITE